MSAKIALSFVKGEDYVATGTHKTRAGALVDITGWTIVFTAREEAADPDPPVITKACVVTDGVNAEYTLTLVSAETHAVPAGVYACDIWRDELGARSQLAHGTVTVVQGVKHP